MPELVSTNSTFADCSRLYQCIAILGGLGTFKQVV